MKQITVDATTFGRVDIFHGGQAGVNNLNAFGGIPDLNHIGVHANMDRIRGGLIPHLPSSPDSGIHFITQFFRMIEQIMSSSGTQSVTQVNEKYILANKIKTAQKNAQKAEQNAAAKIAKEKASVEKLMDKIEKHGKPGEPTNYLSRQFSNKIGQYDDHAVALGGRRSKRNKRNKRKTCKRK